MARGEHVRVSRGLYDHHGIDCGDGFVIEYSGGLFDSGPVRRVFIADFAEGSRIEWMHDETLPLEEVARRAESRLGEDNYSLTSNNCEHLAEWAATGEARSPQVENRTPVAVGVASYAAVSVLTGAGPVGVALLVLGSPVGQVALGLTAVISVFNWLYSD
jgi:hypothetical protein